MDFKKLITTLLALQATACVNGVSYNGSPTVIQQVSYPKLGQTVTSYIGDRLVAKGYQVEENALIVEKEVDGRFYHIPAGTYRQIGFDRRFEYYAATGVTPKFMAQPVTGLAVERDDLNEVCVVTIVGKLKCNRASLEKGRQRSEQGKSFQQTLLYSGRVGNKINIGYREFSSNTARPAFNNNVEYDLSTSNIIGYKGAQLEVLKADNQSITYKLIKNFP